MDSNEIDIYPLLWCGFSNLQVFIPQADCTLTLKPLAGREREAEDIAAPCVQLAIQTREQTLALVDRYAEQPWRRRNFLASPLVQRALEQVCNLRLRQRLFA